MGLTQTLALLDALTPLVVEKRPNRSLQLLAAPGLRPTSAEQPGNWAEWCAGWAFAIQPTLATALDIQQTQRVTDKVAGLEWTQGSSFDFRESYIIYDAPEAWALPWGEALHHIRLALQITDAIPASPAVAPVTEQVAIPGKPNRPAKDGERRYRGEVTFRTLRPNADCTVLEHHGEPQTVSQDEFVRILITGNIQTQD